MIDPQKVNIVFSEAFARLAPGFDPLETHYDNFMAAHKAAFAEAVAYMEREILAGWALTADPRLPTPRADAAWAALIASDVEYPGNAQPVHENAQQIERELADALMVIGEISRRATFYGDSGDTFAVFAGSKGALNTLSHHAGPALLAAIGKINQEKF